MSEPAHSLWSASKFESLMLCPGKHVLEAGLPNNGNKYSAEGTAAHQVLTWALQEDRPAAAYLGRIIMVEDWTFEVDDEMVEHVQVCIDYVKDLAGDDGIIFADIRVNYSTFLDTPHDEAWGTADVIVARGNELMTVDFKYGRGVEVSAEKNPQMSLYALGALQAYHGLVEDFEHVRMAICQPRVRKAPSEWDCTVNELLAWGINEARAAVKQCQQAALNPDVKEPTWTGMYLNPTEKGCRFCKAKATCPALRAEVSMHTFSTPAAIDEFDDGTKAADPKTFTEADLGRTLAACDLIEDFTKAVRAEAERRLLAGEPVKGFKLVAGKKGARQWSDAKAAEEKLKSMRLKIEQMFDMKLISPTSAEKLYKAGEIGPRQWPALQEIIVQKDGAPHVAPASDSRPALDLRPVADDFEVLA
jgi:hypothetical protein